MSANVNLGIETNVDNHEQFVDLSVEHPEEHSSEVETRGSDRNSIRFGIIRVIQEPLVHFLVLGAILFGLYFWVGSASLNGALPSQIEITPGAIEVIKNDWRRQWQKDPSPEELQQAIDQYVRDEIFYREALALEMDQNDLIIRRRLVQKMEFLAEDVAAVQEPTDAELQTYLEAHPQPYAISPRLSFFQLYFSQELRGDQVDRDARQVLAKLQGNPVGIKRAEQLGDRSMLPRSFVLASKTELENLFGAEFAAAIATVTRTGWQGPLHSAYGSHLVNVTEVIPGHPATLAEVRDEVRLDWLQEQRRERDEDFYQQLRDRYRVKVAPAIVPSASKVGVD
jgi:hypothetical protein